MLTIACLPTWHHVRNRVLGPLVLKVCLFSLRLSLSDRSAITTLTAWWRLVLVGLLVVGLFPMFLSPIIGKEESVVTAIGAISLWILYLVWYALKHVLLEGSGSTPSGGKDQKKRLNVTIVTGFLVSCAHAPPPEHAAILPIHPRRKMRTQPCPKQRVCCLFFLDSMAPSKSILPAECIAHSRCPLG